MFKLKIEIKWAFVFVLTILLWSFLEKVTGLHDKHIDLHATFSAFFMVPAILVYFLAIRDKKQNFYQGNIRFSQGFTTGLWITIFVAVLNPATQWIISYVISPEYFTTIIDYSVQNELNTLEEAQAYFNYRSYVIQGTVGALFLGFITSLVIAFVLKSKKKKA